MTYHKITSEDITVLHRLLNTDSIVNLWYHNKITIQPREHFKVSPGSPPPYGKYNRKPRSLAEHIAHPAVEYPDFIAAIGLGNSTKIKAVKWVRQQYNVDLWTAKYATEALMYYHNHTSWPADIQDDSDAK